MVSAGLPVGQNPVGDPPAPPSAQGLLTDTLHSTPVPPLPDPTLVANKAKSDAKSMASATEDRAAADANRAQTTAGRTVDPAVDGALGQVHAIQGMVPADPLNYLGGQLKPVRDTADSVQTFIFPGQGPQASEAPMVAGQVTGIETPIDPALVAVSATAAAAALALLWIAGSSGSMGAGAAGAAGTGTGGKLASTDLKRLLPFASPLFTRFEKETVLGHPKREALYALILQAPGVSLQSLCDSTGLSRTAVTHHLRLLELQHLIVSKRMGRSRHYYENGGRFGRDQKEAYAVLQNDRSKQVARYVQEHPGAIQKLICEALALQPSVAHWHLARLQQALLVESIRQGRTVSYFPGTSLKSLDNQVVPPSVLVAPTVA